MLWLDSSFYSRGQAERWGQILGGERHVLPGQAETQLTYREQGCLSASTWIEARGPSLLPPYCPDIGCELPPRIVATLGKVALFGWGQFPERASAMSPEKCVSQQLWEWVPCSESRMRWCTPPFSSATNRKRICQVPREKRQVRKKITVLYFLKISSFFKCLLKLSVICIHLMLRDQFKE